MIVKSFPSCCTASILCALTVTHDGNEGREFRPKRNATRVDIIKEIMNKKRGKEAFVCCVTDTTQPEANEVLRWVGFQSSMLMSSGKYKRKVRLWWYPVQSFEPQHPRYAKYVKQIEEEQAKKQGEWV